jgi:hypothetical protein
MTTNDNFARVVREFAPRLAKDVKVALDRQAPLWGNLGHESRGMTALQEGGIKIKDPKKPELGPGGWSWAQWTGPRRRQFFSYCKINNLDPASDEAAYLFLAHELKAGEPKAVPALLGPGTLLERVVAFEMAFERAGVKHYDMRHEWAMKAQEIIKTMTAPEPEIAPVPNPKKEAAGIVAAILAALAAGIAALFHQLGINIKEFWPW